MHTIRPVRVLTAGGLLAGLLLVAGADPAGACGGLVGENGTIQLTRTSTLAAYHDGVERYVTSFEFTGTGESVGSIIPLPAVPTDVGDDAIRIELPVPAPTCPQCGADVA